MASRLSAFMHLLESCDVTGRDGSSLGLEAGIARVIEILAAVRADGASLYLLGNGGSAAIASHAAVDFLNVGGIRATTLHESSLLSCMANDYGYATAFERVLGTMARRGDALVAVSSSGKSPNIVNAANRMSDLGGMVVTFSGFAADNPLRSCGDANFWIESRDYGLVEIGHQFLLHNLSDRLPRPAAKQDV